MDEIKWYQKFRLVSPENPLRLSYFRSDSSVREEQLRHLKISKCSIHPFSKFRAWYEVYLIYLYGSVLLTKPIDAGITQSRDCNTLFFYKYYNNILDILCWVDIVLNFFTGYEVRGYHMIELRTQNIAKHYMFGPFFIIDFLSSYPKCLFFYVAGLISKERSRPRFIVGGIVSILGMLKLLRIVTFIKCIWRSAEYFQIKSKGMLFLICTTAGTFIVVHWLACMQYAMSRLVRINFTPQILNISWFYADDIYNGNLYTTESLLNRYNHGLFKSTAYILSIRLDVYKVALPEEYLLAVFTYIVGKVLIGFNWIILGVAIINSRIMEIKFIEKVNQLEEYMKQRQLPKKLQERIIQHFQFKYRNRYFKEQLITSLLSDNLKKETVMHACKFLIQNVRLFNEMNPADVRKVVSNLISEIFLPNDIIIHAGTHGDAMYFLFSGTVAVYTRSGREICHLQEGAYFGEICLLMKAQLRSASVVALEACQVYKLKKRDLEKVFLVNKQIKHTLLKTAEQRLKESTKIEEEYKKMLFEESIRAISKTHYK